jgi:Protein of unknown function (DUF2490)
MYFLRKNLIIVFFFITAVSFAQNDRYNDYNNLVWLQSFNTIKLNNKWSLHAEYQWRRDNGLKDWQQSLLRIGGNYKIIDNVIVHVGYAWVETFPYGKFPIASNGTFTEHRLYEQLTLRQSINKFLLTHRFRIEQRWLGRVKAGTDREIEEWLFLHRFRYQFRTQYNFNKKWYGAFADEIFIGAGKNVGVNIFDQNRIFALAGYKVNSKLSVEAGYFNQTLMQGRRINNQTIVQRNNGLVVSSILNL